MTEQTTKDVIVYTIQDDNKINIIGEFENIILCVIDCNHDPYIEGETQAAFVLENGALNLDNKPVLGNALVMRSPKVNISYNSFEIDFNTNKVIGNIKGRYDLVKSKIDSYDNILHTKNGMTLRVEGVAEYIKFIPQTVEEFITNNK